MSQLNQSARPPHPHRLCCGWRLSRSEFSKRNGVSVGLHRRHIQALLNTDMTHKSKWSSGDGVKSSSFRPPDVRSDRTPECKQCRLNLCHRSEHLWHWCWPPEDSLRIKSNYSILLFCILLYSTPQSMSLLTTALSDSKSSSLFLVWLWGWL